MLEIVKFKKFKQELGEMVWSEGEQSYQGLLLGEGRLDIEKTIVPGTEYYHHCHIGENKPLQ